MKGLDLNDKATMTHF